MTSTRSRVRRSLADALMPPWSSLVDLVGFDEVVGAVDRGRAAESKGRAVLGVEHPGPRAIVEDIELAATPTSEWSAPPWRPRAIHSDESNGSPLQHPTPPGARVTQSMTPAVANPVASLSPASGCGRATERRRQPPPQHETTPRCGAQR